MHLLQPEQNTSGEQNQISGSRSLFFPMNTINFTSSNAKEVSIENKQACGTMLHSMYIREENLKHIK